MKQTLMIASLLVGVYSHSVYAGDAPTQCVAKYMSVEEHKQKFRNGVSYDAMSLTATSPNIPVGKPVRVCNLETSKCVDVTIVAPRAYSDTSCITLSWNAASSIDGLAGGNVKVSITVLDPK